MKLRTHTFKNSLCFLPDEEQSQGNGIISAKLKEQLDLKKKSDRLSLSDHMFIVILCLN